MPRAQIVRSLVMVEDPYPGARVVNELVVRGESNTFEATVRYILTDRGGDGRIIDEGFTTATNGNGTWGTYEIRIDLDALPRYAPGPGAIIVWDEDLRRNLAMKVMLDGASPDGDKCVRFIEEAQVTGQLEHPGIVPVYELGVGSRDELY